MGVAAMCVYCQKPLLDAEHARKHVVNQCEASPTKKLADALEETATFLEMEAENYRDGDRYQPHGRALVSCAKSARTALRAAGRIP